MKRNHKDEDKESGVSNAASGSNNNNNSNNSFNTSGGSNEANATVSSSGTAATVRTTGRVKKPKLVFDPSDNYVARPPRNSMPALGAAQAPAAGNAAKSVAKAETGQQAAAVAAAGGAAEQQKVMYDTCMKCDKSELKRGSGHKSNYITCKTCLQKWHYACLPVSFDSASAARKKFRCEKCRYCYICMTVKQGKPQKELIMCSGCADVYHLDCHRPAVLRSMLYDPKWKCRKCDASYNKPSELGKRNKLSESSSSLNSNASSSSVVRKSTGGGGGGKKPTDLDMATATGKGTASNSSLISPAKPPSLCLTEHNLSLRNGSESKENPTPAQQQKELPPPPLGNKNQNKQLNVLAKSRAANFEQPVQNWTVDQVVNYIHKRYPHEAEIFKFQDIDGASLMLLTRQDILDRFGLKLGPSLRLFELVSALQSSIDDVTVAWWE